MFNLKYIRNLVSIFEESEIYFLEIYSWGREVKITGSSRLCEYVEIPRKEKEDPRSVEGRVRNG